MSERAAISSPQLKIWALLILYQMAHNRRAEGYPRSWLLRFLLAFLYTHAKGGDRSSFDGFWKAATRAKTPDVADGAAAKMRGVEMKREANGICKAVGEEPKEMQDRFWDELTREAYASRGETVRILK